MNVFHKSKKGVALFVLIMFLCTMMPFSAFAAEPSDYDAVPMAEGSGPDINAFKYMKLNSATSYYNASTCMMQDMLNWYYYPINLNDWAILSFAVQMTQPVDLKVYKANNDYCAEYDEKEKKEILKKNVQLGMLYEDQFCGEFVGYIEGYELAGENHPDNLTEEQLRTLIASIINGGEADRKDYYVNKRIKGYTEDVLPGGRSLFSLFGVQEEATTGNSLEVTSGSALAFEITEETTTEQALQLMALADDTELEITPIDFIHNLIMWDGTVVDENGENPQKLAADENYIIVLEPSTPSMNYYRSYLAIRTTNSIPDDILLSLREFAELFQMITGDPVDLLTGALNWEYTDISMYGDEDLPYTRYYNSKAAGEAGRLGYGWSDNYT